MMVLPGQEGAPGARKAGGGSARLWAGGLQVVPCWTALATEQTVPLLEIVGTVTLRTGSAVLALGARQHKEQDLEDGRCWLQQGSPRRAPPCPVCPTSAGEGGAPACSQSSPLLRFLSRGGAHGRGVSRASLPPCAEQAWEKESRGLRPAPLARFPSTRAPAQAQAAPSPLVLSRRWGTQSFPCLGPLDPSGPWAGVSSQRKGPARLSL